MLIHGEGSKKRVIRHNVGGARTITLDTCTGFMVLGKDRPLTAVSFEQLNCFDINKITSICPAFGSVKVSHSSAFGVVFY